MAMSIILSSDAYAEETFKYKNLREALSGVERLVRASKKEYKKDHVPREIKILISNAEEKHDPALAT